MTRPDAAPIGCLAAVIGFGVALAGVPLLWRGWALLYALLVRGPNVRLESHAPPPTLTASADPS